MEQLEERVDDVEDDIGETKIKVEEIDNKVIDSTHYKAQSTDML